MALRATIIQQHSLQCNFLHFLHAFVFLDFAALATDDLHVALFLLDLIRQRPIDLCTIYTSLNLRFSAHILTLHVKLNVHDIRHSILTDIIFAVERGTMLIALVDTTDFRPTFLQVSLLPMLDDVRVEIEL